MPTEAPDYKLNWWEFEPIQDAIDRARGAAMEAWNASAPYAEQGDWDAASGAISATLQGVDPQPPQAPAKGSFLDSAMANIRDSLKAKWSAPADSTPEPPNPPTNPLQNTDTSIETASPGLDGETNTVTTDTHVLQPGETLPAPPDDSGSGWLDAVKNAVSKVAHYKTPLGSLVEEHPGSAEGLQQAQSDFSTPHGNAIVSAISGGHLQPENLPGPLSTLTNIAADPGTLITSAAGGAAAAPADSLLSTVGKRIALQWGREAAAGTVGTLAAQGVEQKLPEGTPEVIAKPLEIGAGLLGGAVTYDPAAMIGPEGALTSGKLNLTPSLGTEDVSGRPPLAGLVDEATAAAPPASRYQVPDIGKGEAEAALRREGSVYKPPMVSSYDDAGARQGGAQGVAGKAVGLLNPSADTNPTVTVANRARGHVQAELSTQFSLAMNPIVRQVKAAIADEKPDYIGPVAKTNAQRGLIGTEKDIVERPAAYNLTAKAKQAVTNLGQAMWNQVSGVARSGYGVDVSPIEISGGGEYLPTILRKDSADTRIESGQKQYGAASGTKERPFETAWERAGTKAHANEQYETDLGELTAVHSEGMARNAANATFKQGVGGLTQTEAKTQFHPELAAKRDALIAKVTSLRARIKTAEQNAGINVRASDELDKVIDDIGARVPEGVGQLAKLGTVLNQQNERAGNLLAPTNERVMTGGGPVRMDVPATAGNLAKGNAMGQVVDAIANVVPDDVEQMRFLEAAVGRSLRRAGVLQERGVLKGAEARGMKAALDDASAQAQQVGKAWRSADPTGGNQLVLDPTTHLYHEPDIAASIAKVGHQNTGSIKGVLDLADEIRAVRFAGDASPVTIQGQLGATARNPIDNLRTAVASVVNPVGTVKRAVSWLKSDPEQNLEAIAQANPEDVAEYSYSMGRPFLRPTQADEAVGAGKGLSRIPVFRAVEDKLWSHVQEQTFGLWKNMRDQELARGSTPEQAAADAASTVQKLIPSQDPTIRGLSPARAQAERAVATSVSFATSPARLIKDAAVGLTKLAASNTVQRGAGWAQLSGSERLAVQRMTYMAGTVTTLSIASAIASAQSRGMSPEDAMKDALNPDSRYFLALQLGQGRSVPLGGPFRSFIKAMAPGNPMGPGGIGGAVSRPFDNLGPYLRSKLAPVPAFGLDMAINEDWAGSPVRGTGAWTKPVNLLKELWYMGESAAPLGLGGQAMQDVRTGAADFSSPLAAVKSLGPSGASQLAGTNYSGASPTEQLSQFSRNWPGNKGGDFFSSPKSVQQAIKDAHPDTWQQYVNGASDNTRANEQAKSKYEGEQAGRDETLLGGGPLAVNQWRNAMDTASKQLQGEQAQIFGQSNQPPRNASDRYYQQINQATQNGVTDWTAVDQWKAQQPQADQDYIDQNTALGGTPLQRFYRDQKKAYDALPKYRGLTADQGRQVDALVTSARNFVRPRPPGQTAPQSELLVGIQKAAEATHAPDSVVGAARAVMMKSILQSPERAAWQRANPDAYVLINGNGQLSPQQLAAIKVDLGK